MYIATVMQSSCGSNGSVTGMHSGWLDGKVD